MVHNAPGQVDGDRRMKLARAFLTIFLNGMAAVLCLSLLVWTIQPVASHVPAVLDVLAEQAQMVEEHGHSHDLEEDLAWAKHGHSHDKADHDHSPAVLIGSPDLHWTPVESTVEAVLPADWRSTPTAPHDRPPRA